MKEAFDIAPQLDPSSLISQKLKLNFKSNSNGECLALDKAGSKQCEPLETKFFVILVYPFSPIGYIGHNYFLNSYFIFCVTMKIKKILAAD